MHSFLRSKYEKSISLYTKMITRHYIQNLECVKLPARGGTVPEKLAGLELRAILVCEAIHEIDVVVDTHRIEETERPSSEGSEAGAED